MNYLSLLDLEKEPFSNSPDPEFFFASNQHMRSLQRLELAIRLRKGLSVALGEVGTGKTTICRRLIRRLGKDGDKMAVHLFLDPEFTSTRDFLQAIADAFGITALNDEASEREIKEALKRHLFSEGVDKEKITVLIIDEGQKLPGFCLEILRELLNFETNQFKLLQIVIFAQLEFRQALQERANFSDRIAELCNLTSLNFSDTRQMILFRIKQAQGRSIPPELFSFWAMVAIYRQTGGYPRKIVQLCSQTLLALIIQNKTKVSASLVKACSNRLVDRTPQRLVLRPVLLVILLAVISFWQWDKIYPVALAQKGQILEAISLAPHKNIKPAPSPEIAPALQIKPEQEFPPAAPAEKSVTAASITSPDQEPTAKTNVESTEELAVKISPAPDTEQSPPEEAVITVAALSLPTETVLGELKINKGDSLGWMIRHVYDTFNPALLQKVIAANPQIPDPDNLWVGAKITFPVACQPHQCANQPGYRLQLGQATTLAKAVRLLKSVLHKKIEAHLVPVWRPETGLNFLILTPTIYNDQETATSALQSLPTSLREKAQTLHDWEEGYLFLSSNVTMNE